MRTPPIIGLESSTQRLHLLLTLGGAVAAWDWKFAKGWQPIFRRWSQFTDDRYSLACFPLVPWSNRITGGGFEQDGEFHPVHPNRDGEPYPIHGDGWLQEWRTADVGESHQRLLLESNGFDGNPYHYVATQTFSLLPNGLQISLDVTHLGSKPLPYGLGLHPYFLKNDATRLRFRSDGIWLSGDDPIPVRHSEEFPPTWDYNSFAPMEGPLIDNCYSGWDGTATIAYPDKGFSVTMTMSDCNGYTLMYRPPEYDYFCLEPITHPIDAFHMPGRPGLVVLNTGQSLALTATFIIDIQ